MSPKTSTEPDLLRRRHLRFGWWALLVFVTLGLTLETLHGFKVDWYLSVDHETRRLLWTLAHAHGTLLAILHLVFAASLPRLADDPSRRRLASWSLLGAAVLLPGGFFLAGFGVWAGDPGPAIILAVPGGLLLFLGVLVTARLTS